MTLKVEEISQFTGTDNWYKHMLSRRIVYTEGARYVAQEGRAYWLLDEIVIAQGLKQVKAEEFQVWTLRVNGNKALLFMGNGNGRVVYQKEIDFTDFPLSEIRLFFSESVIMLPGEW